MEDIAGVDDKVNIAMPDDIVDHGAIGVLDIERAQVAAIGIAPEVGAVAEVRIGM